MNAVEIYEKASWDVEHNKITLGEFEERIKPLYDVEPVRHGHWIRESVGSDNSSEGYFKISMAECSECGTCVMGKPNYCPNCGARMRMTKEQYESHVGDIYEDGEEE